MFVMSQILVGNVGTEQDQFPCGPTGTSSEDTQETETSMVRDYDTTPQPLQTHSARHLGVLATPWSAEEMLDGQRGHPGLSWNCSLWLLAEKTGRGSRLIHSSFSPDNPIGRGTELNLIKLMV